MIAISTEAVKVSAVCQMIPTAKPPAATVVSRLAIEDQVLLARLLAEPCEYVRHQDFSKRSIERKLFGGESKYLKRGACRFHENPDPVTDAVLAGERVPTLAVEQERHLFTRFNYARKQVFDILNKHAEKRLTSEATRQLLAWGYRVLASRGVIVRINLPLVLAMAKRTRLTGIDLNELISEGNMALLRSVEKFDSSRGFKFSTYSCRAILKSFSRVAMRASRYRGKFPTEFDPAMERSDYLDKKRISVEADCVDELKEILIRNVAGLSEVEKTVIHERFAIGQLPIEEHLGPKTLEQVGRIIGVTKERVRQIQNNALKKIKIALETEYLAA